MMEELLINRLIFVGTLAFFVLIILIWKKFKPDSWVLEEFEDHPISAEDAPDYPLYPKRWISVEGKFPSGLYYLPEALIRNDLDDADVTKKKLYEPVTLAEYQEFIEKMRARERRKRSEEGEPSEKDRWGE